MKEILLGYQGEMSLKGLNKNQFEAALTKILRYRLRDLGPFRIYCAQSTYYMEPQSDDIDMDAAYARVSTVFGFAALSRSVVCDKDFETVCRTAEQYLGAQLDAAKTFKVEARRADKTYPLTSPEIMRELGGYLLERHPRLKVDVHTPEFKVIVEIRDFGAYIHGPKLPARAACPWAPAAARSTCFRAASTAPWPRGAWHAAAWRCTTSILLRRPIRRSARAAR